jgi:transposase
VTRQARRNASFLVATNVLEADQLSDHELVQIYTVQHSVERGFAFLKDPDFLASSVFVKKPERIVALSLVMVLCLLGYRLAEHRLREQLAATGQTVPNQLKHPTERPTLFSSVRLYSHVTQMYQENKVGHSKSRTSSGKLQYATAGLEIDIMLKVGHSQLILPHKSTVLMRIVGH